MPKWSKIQFWKKSTSPFRCLTKWKAEGTARVHRSAASAGPGIRGRSQGPLRRDRFRQLLPGVSRPGFRTQREYEEIEKPSFENFLSQPTTLTDHLAWQLGALTIADDLVLSAELVIGNLNEDGYLAATEEELAAAYKQFKESAGSESTASNNGSHLKNGDAPLEPPSQEHLDLIRRGIDLVQHLDPAGVGARNLRECLMLQIAAQQQEFVQLYGKNGLDSGEDPHRGFRAEAELHLEERRHSMEAAALIVDRHLQLLQKRDVKDLARATQLSQAEVHAGVEFIRTLDPRPGRLYNREQTRLIEPDVVFLKRGGEWVVSMNEEELPSLRLSQRYRRMLTEQDTDKEVKEYVKERFRSAMQLMRNIAQRKSTILRTCEVIVGASRTFSIRALRRSGR